MSVVFELIDLIWFDWFDLIDLFGKKRPPTHNTYTWYYITTFWISVHYNILVICTLQHSGYLYITTFWLSVHYNILVIWIFDFRPKVLTNVWAAFYKNWNEYERYVAYKKRFAKISETRKSRVCLILTWLKCSSMYAIPNFVGTSIRPLFFHRFSLKINTMLYHIIYPTRSVLELNCKTWIQRNETN